jgi:translation initiation factor IF-1
VHLCERKRLWQTNGRVVAVLAASNFRIETIDGVTMLARCSGRMVMNKVGLSVGDEVIIEYPAFAGELSWARITKRFQ